MTIEKIDEKNVDLHQIRPHFLYNVLNCIKCSAMLGKDNTVELIDELAKYLRYVLKQYDETEMIDAESAIAFLKTYATLEEARFPRVHIEFDMHKVDCKVPPFWLKELLHNAIHHGILEKSDGGEVRVCSFMDEHSCYFTIKDEGIGMSNNAVEAAFAGRGSLGLIKKEVDFIGGKIKIEGEDVKGTLVILEVPLQKGEEINEDIAS